MDFLEAENQDKDEEEKRSPIPYRIDDTKLKLTYDYEFEVKTDEYGEEEDQEENKDGDQNISKIGLTVRVQILEVDGKTHCVDFSLKDYKVDGVKSDDNLEARKHFICHFREMIENKNIKTYNDAEYQSK